MSNLTISPMFAITVVAIITVVGCILGAFIGKQQIKRLKHPKKAVLTKRQRVICAALLVLGAGMIIFAQFTMPDTVTIPNDPSVNNGITDLPAGELPVDESGYPEEVVADAPAEVDAAVALG
jgi:hypothetical protein